MLVSFLLPSVPLNNGASLPVSKTEFLHKADHPLPTTTTTSIVDVRSPPHRRQDYAGNVCGYDSTDSVPCLASLSCEGTILPNFSVYQYCSSIGAPVQSFWTTAHSFDIASSCPPYELCCGRDQSYVQTNFYVVSGFTATGFGCDTTTGTKTWIPNRDISHLLVHLSTDTTPVPSISKAISTNELTSGDPVPSNSVPTTIPSPTSTTIVKNSLSEESIIALGVGIGVGLPGSIAAIATCYIAWKYRHVYFEPMVK